jgi:hypothetical protein
MTRKEIAKRIERSDEDLREASKALAYEVEVFITTADLLQDLSLVARVKGRKWQWLQNPLLESFLIHTRILMDFLYPDDSPDEDDIIANDFFDDWQAWNPMPSDESKEVMKARKWRINKQLAHLTYTRLGVSQKDKEWVVEYVTEEIFRTLEVFVRKAPDERLHAQFSEVLGKVRREYGYLV